MLKWTYNNYGLNFNLFTRQKFLKKLEFIFIVVVSVFFTVIFSTLISPFNCKYQADGNYFLWNAPSLSCFEGEWLNVHLPLIVLFLLIYQEDPSKLRFFLFCFDWKIVCASAGTEENFFY
jgi:hypothetical protein